MRDKTGITPAEADAASLSAEDVEKTGLSDLERAEEALLQREGDHGIKRDLKPRVVSMIAIAGTIGTGASCSGMLTAGLFLSSGSALTVSPQLLPCVWATDPSLAAPSAPSSGTRSWASWSAR